MDPPDSLQAPIIMELFWLSQAKVPKYTGDSRITFVKRKKKDHNQHWKLGRAGFQQREFDSYQTGPVEQRHIMALFVV